MSAHAFAVCAYKASPFLRECLASLDGQTEGSEVVVCTSTPNDHIRKLAAEFGYPLRVKDGEPGIGSDWNFAINCVESPYVTIAHQDDVYCPDYSAHALKAMEASMRPLIFFANYGELRKGSKVDSGGLLQTKRTLLLPMRRKKAASSIATRRRILSFGSSICCPSVTLAVDNLPKPIFDERLKCDLDWDAWERISKIEGDFIYDPEILMYHRIHEDSETTAMIRNNTRAKEDLNMLTRFWPRGIAKIIHRVYSLGERFNR